MNKNILKIFIVFIILFFASCKLRDIDLNDIEVGTEDPDVSVQIAKWYNNHTAAISLNNDAGSVAIKHEQTVQKAVMESNLTMDYEFVTDIYQKDSTEWNYFKNTFLPNGFRYFGHGHTHINHDLLSEANSYKSFKKCYDVMVALGLKPVTYAYPGGFGNLLRTQRAVKNAGFIAARMFEKLDNENPYIIPDDETEPSNWFALPTLVMQAYDYVSCTICINNTQQLIPHLDKTLEKTAWLILTYHAIGQKNNFGFYHLDDFKTDLEEINKRDFWVSHNDDIALYIFERNNANVSADMVDGITKNNKKIEIQLDDNLDNNKYNIPLTLLLNVPQNWLRKELELKQNDTTIGFYEFEANPIKISLLPNEKRYELIKK